MRGLSASRGLRCSGLRCSRSSVLAAVSAAGCTHRTVDASRVAHVDIATVSVDAGNTAQSYGARARRKDGMGNRVCAAQVRRRDKHFLQRNSTFRFNETRGALASAHRSCKVHFKCSSQVYILLRDFRDNSSRIQYSITHPSGTIFYHLSTLQMYGMYIPFIYCLVLELYINN